MQRQFSPGLARAGSSVQRWSSRLVGLCGALLLHALLFQAVTLGTSARKSRAPEETGPGASAVVSGANMSMTLVLVQLPGVEHSNTLEEIASRGFAPANAAIQVVSPDPAPAFDGQETAAEQDADAAVTAGDPAVRSMLFGRYTGQISARIERAWRKPRSPVVDETTNRLITTSGTESSDPARKDLFQCSVRITQDIRGNVKETELLRCNGTLAWQRSLIDAIQEASPLPAPPSPTVFTNALTLTFEARAFVRGENEDGYELARVGR